MKTRKICVIDLVLQNFETVGTRSQSEGIQKYPGDGSEEVHKMGSWREHCLINTAYTV